MTARLLCPTPRLRSLLGAALLGGAMCAGTLAAAGPDERTGVPAPEFTHTNPHAWLNSGPLTLARLRGTVVLVDFWTFDCWNCHRSFPWLRALEERFVDDRFTVIGVHSPEFDHEREVDKVRAKVDEFRLTHPIMIDNDFSYWRAMGNRYWPAFYLIDKRGLVREVFVGETHAGDSQARRIQSAVAGLLLED